MDSEKGKAELQNRIRSLEDELSTLKAQLRSLEDREMEQKSRKLPLRIDDYKRYGRQMILPGFGLESQLKLHRARLLVVGAGGLGCPVLLYLAGAGVGQITVVDSDTVEMSNLHRQVLHTQDRVGMSKARSAQIGMNAINPRIQVVVVEQGLTRETLATLSELALDHFTLVIDCTDNARTRYCLSDACVRADVPLVSGGAIGLEGWSGVWNLPPAANPAADDRNPDQARGPCLRCVYPSTAHDDSGNCEDEGVLGTVTGTIGTLMANEAIKLLVGLHDRKPSMTLFSPLSTPMFRNLRLRSRKPGCPGCADPGILPALPEAVEQCGTTETDQDCRVSAKELKGVLESQQDVTIVDVRSPSEYSICSLPGSLNIPHSSILRDPDLLERAINEHKACVLVCRQGNDSLEDARLFKSRNGRPVKDLRGGLRAWTKLDPEFPMY